MSDNIKGKVARVLSDKEIAINIGFIYGVSNGDIYDLVNIMEIQDPDSSVILGEFNYTKVSLKVDKVYEKFSILSVIEDKFLVLDINMGIYTKSLMANHVVPVRIGDIVVYRDSE